MNLHELPDGATATISGQRRGNRFYPDGGLNMASIPVDDGPWLTIKAELNDYPVGTVITDDEGDHLVKVEAAADGYRLLSGNGLPASNTTWSLSDLEGVKVILLGRGKW